jgi:hypothetical protein
VAARRIAVVRAGRHLTRCRASDAEISSWPSLRVTEHHTIRQLSRTYPVRDRLCAGFRTWRDVRVESVTRSKAGVTRLRDVSDVPDDLSAL